MKKMMATEEEVDFQPALVGALARVGGDRARQTLAQAIAGAQKGTWIGTWMAVGLLELGDASHIDLARAALGRRRGATRVAGGGRDSRPRFSEEQLAARATRFG